MSDGFTIVAMSQLRPSISECLEDLQRSNAQLSGSGESSPIVEQNLSRTNTGRGSVVRERSRSPDRTPMSQDTDVDTKLDVIATEYKQGARVRRWMFTLDFDPEAVPAFDEKVHHYLVYQVEIGRRSGFKHVQGYVEFFNPQRLSFLQKSFGRRAKYLVARGTGEECRMYCTKEDTRCSAPNSGPWEWGELLRQGQRSDLEDVKRRLDDGATMGAISREFFGQFCRYNRGFEKYAMLNPIRRSRPPHVIIMSGPTGVGKTRMAESRGAYTDVCWKPPYDGSGADHWFDGYCGQRVFLWDEFTEGQCKLPFLLRLLDRYPLMVQTKGSYINFTPEEIIITTNENPNDWYGGHLLRDMIPQLKRRVHHHFVFDANGNFTDAIPHPTYCEGCNGPQM